MKSWLLISVVSIFITSISYGQELENLPEKVPAYKVDIILHKRNHIKGYLVDVTDEALLIVKDKSMVEVAVKDDCASCSVVHHRSVYDIKGRNSISTTLGIAGAIVGAGIIWAMSGDPQGGESPSERNIRYLYVIEIGLPIIMLAVLFDSRQPRHKYHPDDLKVYSSRYQFYKKCGETVRAFIHYGRLHKRYSFYIDANFRRVEGKLISKEPGLIRIQPEGTNQLMNIEIARVKCVKK